MNVFQNYLARLASPAGFVFLAMLAACGGDQGRTPILGLPAATFTSLAITPASATLASGNTQQLTAVASFSDGARQDVSASAVWSSATPASVTVAASGLATARAPGNALVSASYAGRLASATLTVGPAVVTALAVIPQVPTVLPGATRQLAVTATYSDASSADVTAASSFVSATPASASVSSTGLVTGVAAGSSIVSASFGGISATTTASVPAGVTLSSLAISPANPSIAVGATQQFIATATYSNLSNAVISANWSSTTAASGSIAASGLATGVAAGTTTIGASFGGLTASTLLTVTALPLPPVIASLNLRSAASFAVLAGTSITNNSGGTTLVAGDVGSPSQTTDPAQVAGFTNYKSGAILSAALADLQTAITDANTRSCDVSFAGGIDLGGLTMGPGVYCYSGAISITGTLTLSGPGVYIFRTTLTLNSTANSIVALKNGAAAADVNWLPVGPTTLGANSVFKGSILGQSAAITLGDGATLQNGRVLTAAAVTLRNNPISK
ncbi:MAG: ice-binding family protein [Pseudomonadota bacterium]